MRLLGVELRRFRLRRAIVVVLLGAALVTGLLLFSTVWSTRPVSAADRADAERQVAVETERLRADQEACETDPESYLGPGATAENCAMNFEEPQVEWFLFRPELDLREQVGDSGVALAVLLAGAALLVGTTFAGADWGSGSMSNQLLFESRRLRLWAAKAAAVVIGTTAAAVVVLAVYWGVLAGVAAARDLTTSGADWRAIGSFLLRSVALTAGVGLGCFALTMLLRATVGTLGATFGFVVISEIAVGTLPFERMARWSPLQNIGAWLQDGVEMYDDRLCGPGGFVDEATCNPYWTLTLGQASAYLGVLLLLAVAFSLWSFARRDV